VVALRKSTAEVGRQNVVICVRNYMSTDRAPTEGELQLAQGFSPAFSIRNEIRRLENPRRFLLFDLCDADH
jgi:hypothetical protein